MNPVSCITSRMSVNFDPLKEFQRFDPNPHFTFLLAGSRSAARPRVPAKTPRLANTSRRVIMVLILSNLIPGHYLGLMQKPLNGVLLHLLIFRVPQGSYCVTGSKEADTAL